MTAPYDWDTIVDSAIRQKPKEPERWRNRYRAVIGMRIRDFDGRVLFMVHPGDEWVSPTVYPNAEEATDGARRFDAVSKAIPGEGSPAEHGRSYLYLGPEKQP